MYRPLGSGRVMGQQAPKEEGGVAQRQWARHGLLPWVLAGLGLASAAAALLLLEIVARDSGRGLFLRLSQALVALAVALGAVAVARLRRIHAGLGRVLDALHLQAMRDEVTGLYNRRYLDGRLEEELSRARRYGRSLALLMLDLDNFKDVNDRLGHRVGDWVLGEVGCAIRQCVRSTDVAARYGGDEFALLLPETGRQGSAALAQRVESAVEALSAQQVVGDLVMRLGMSWGVAQYPEDGTTASELMLSADRALYQAKRQRAG